MGLGVKKKGKVQFYLAAKRSQDLYPLGILWKKTGVLVSDISLATLGGGGSPSGALLFSSQKLVAHPPTTARGKEIQDSI